MKYFDIILVAATTTTALIAGLMYSYLISINPAFARLTDREYISAMKAINEAIQNPLFFMSFMGAALLLPLATYLNYHQPIELRFLFLLAASIIYIIGCFGITIAYNVPLNNILANFSPDLSSSEQITSMRLSFEKPWNYWHTIRTFASTISLILTVIACLSFSGK